MRGDGPVDFAQVTHDAGVAAILDQLLGTWQRALAASAPGDSAAAVR
jgi:hypothetical protein